MSTTAHKIGSLDSEDPTFANPFIVAGQMLVVDPRISADASRAAKAADAGQGAVVRKAHAPATPHARDASPAGGVGRLAAGLTPDPAGAEASSPSLPADQTLVAQALAAGGAWAPSRAVAGRRAGGREAAFTSVSTAPALDAAPFAEEAHRAAVPGARDASLLQPAGAPAGHEPLATASSTGNTQGSGVLWFGSDDHLDGDSYVGTYSFSSGAASTILKSQYGYGNVAVDNADGLWFAESNESGQSTNSSGIVSGFITGGAGTPNQGAQAQFLGILTPGNNYNVDGLVVDPVNHVLYYAYVGPDDSTTGIDKIGYNPTTGVMTNEGLVVTAAPGKLQSPFQLYLDVANQVLYYVDDTTKADSSLFDDATNGIYKVSLSNPSATPTEITSDAQFLGSGAFPNGGIVGMAVNAAQKLIYFVTEDNGVVSNSYDASGAGQNVDTSEDSLWVVSMNGSGNTATKLTLPGYTLGSPTIAGSLVYDPVANQLYLSDNYNDKLVQLSLNAAGTAVTALTSYTPPNSSANGVTFVDAPQLASFSGPSGEAVQGGSAIQVLAATPSVSDANPGGDLASARIQITSGGHAGDALSILGVSNGTVDGGRIAVSGLGTSTLTLTGVDTAAEYAALLDEVTYTDGGSDPSTGAHPTRGLTFTVSNGELASSATTTLTIDRAPTSAVAAYFPDEGGQSAGFVANGDPDGDTLSVTSVTGQGGPVAPGQVVQGSYGALQLNANGGYSYLASNTAAIEAAPTGAHPVDTFTYTVSDGHGGGANETLRFVIDRAPTLSAGAAVGYTDGAAAVSADAALTASDPDGDVLASAEVTVSSGFIAGDVLSAATSGTPSPPATTAVPACSPCPARPRRRSTSRCWTASPSPPLPKQWPPMARTARTPRAPCPTRSTRATCRRQPSRR